MIVFLRGRLAAKSGAAVVIDCNGIGYEAQAPLTTIEKLPPVGEDVFLHIDLVVRQESHTLYGFLDEPAREIFRRLIKVSGVGAKTALALMSALADDELLSALSDGDAARLSRAPGIGKKTAERIIVDFRGSDLAGLAAGGGIVGGDRDVEQALIGLGYKRAEIVRAMSALPPSAGEDTAARLRAVLQILSTR